MLASNTLTAAPPCPLKCPLPFLFIPFPPLLHPLPSYLKEVSNLQSQSISNSILNPLPFPIYIQPFTFYSLPPFLFPSLHSQRVSNLLSQSPNPKAVTVFCNLLPYFVMYTLSEYEIFPKFPTPNPTPQSSPLNVYENLK